jgi:hypothetical protein
MSSIDTIPNLGPASVAQFARAGIHSAEDLRALGADAAYGKLLAAGNRPHFIGYYAMVMGLQGRPWNDCRGAEKEALRARFDAICAANKPSPASGIEAILDQIGVVARPRP